MKMSVLIVVYIAAIVAANQLIATYGPSAVVYVGAGLVALNLTTRDRLHDIFAQHRIPKMLLLIAAGSLLSYAVSDATARIALASAVAFAGSEVADATLYQAMRRRPWMERCNASNLLGAAVDTVVFFYLAFGAVPIALAFAQGCAKVAGGVVYSLARR